MSTNEGNSKASNLYDLGVKVGVMEARGYLGTSEHSDATKAATALIADLDALTGTQEAKKAEVVTKAGRKAIQAAADAAVAIREATAAAADAEADAEKTDEAADEVKP